MSISTIKSKLILLLVVLLTSFGILGYELNHLASVGKAAALRLAGTSEIEEHILQMRLEQRNYQIYFQQKNLDSYKEHYQDAVKQMETLSGQLFLKTNQEKVITIKKGIEAWYALNEQRMALWKKYGKKVHEPSFELDHKADYEMLERLAKESGEIFNPLLVQLKDIIDQIQTVNFEKLDTDKLTSITLLIVVIIVVLIIFFIINSSIQSSVERAKKSCDAIIQTKDLSLKIETGSHDEISGITHAVNTLLAELKNAISNAKSNAIENASVAEELSSTSLQIGKRAEEESAIVFQTTSDAGIVSSQMDEASSQAKKVKEVTGNAQKSLTIAQDLLEETIAQLNQTAHAEAAINERLNHLSEEAQQVRSVLDVIGDIADQTNLLALNAAIEAARAGEHGRGFAVVADEVRKLAERTQKSLVDTNATVNVIVQSIGDISGEMNGNAKRINELTEFSTKVTTQTNDAVAMLAQSVEATDEVVEKANANVKLIQSAVIEKISTINELSSSNARSVEEIASAAEHLSKLAGSLSSTLSQFKTA